MRAKMRLDAEERSTGLPKFFGAVDKNVVVESGHSIFQNLTSGISAHTTRNDPKHRLQASMARKKDKLGKRRTQKPPCYSNEQEDTLK